MLPCHWAATIVPLCPGCPGSHAPLVQSQILEVELNGRRMRRSLTSSLPLGSGGIKVDIQRSPLSQRSRAVPLVLKWNNGVRMKRVVTTVEGQWKDIDKSEMMERSLSELREQAGRQRQHAVPCCVSPLARQVSILLSYFTERKL